VDVENSANAEILDSAPAVLEQPKSLPGDEDLTVRANSGTQVSGSPASEQSIGLPCDLEANDHSATGIVDSPSQTSEEPKAFSDEEPVQIRNEPN
jgi:hypothetical protein